MEFCLQVGGVSESFTHKMSASEICLQNGGNAAFLRVLPTRWRRKQKQRRICITFAFSECNVKCQTIVMSQSSDIVQGDREASVIR